MSTGAVESGSANLRWGVAKRLEFIEFRLVWYGRLNRRELMDEFSLSPQQASSDIALYEKIAPSNLEYDKNEKAYMRTKNFNQKFLRPASDRLLLQAAGIRSGWLAREDTWFSELPPIEVSGLPRWPVDTKNLISILDAIRSRQQVEVNYKSLSGSPAGPRLIAPHSLIQGAGRFYVRAWSEEHNDFRDYNLARIDSVGHESPSPIDSGLDYEWHHLIDLIIAPNNNLPEQKQAAIADEYGMDDGRLVVTMRVSLCFYLMTENNLDIPLGVLKPEKQQLVLLNQEEVFEARSATRRLSKEALARVQLRNA